MAKKQKKFADDGWAVWVDGDDISTIYINDWLNPKGKSYIDIAVRVRGVKDSKTLNVYVPFSVSSQEIEDVSLLFNNSRILQATFSATCIIEYKKNEHTSEIAYNGKTIDIVHFSTLENEYLPIADGTLIKIDLEKLHPYLDNNEAYFIWRMPHKSLDEIFAPKTDMKNVLGRLRDLITTPVVSEKYGYSIRINESRLLPEEITKIGVFHRQKLKKSVVTISVNESYELNDSGCYRIRRIEEKLYSEFLPKDYNCENVITYQWQQDREDNLKGQFNYYYNIAKNSVSRASMFIYLVLLLTVGVLGNMLTTLLENIFKII